MVNVLTHPVFSVRDRSDTVSKVTLPELYAMLVTDWASDLPALRPHHRQPMHAFLVQLGAIALNRAGETEPPEEAKAWTALLRGLTPEFRCDEPWSLVFGDISKPALLQPPIPEGRIDVLAETEETPDALDVLVTSRNHDVKSRRLVRATPEHWFAALLTLQTMEGFLGVGNYGISRMNGGFASRPMVSLVPEGGPGARLRRDMSCLLARRGEPENEGYMKENGKALLWLDPWDGTCGLRAETLDPWYIEICRRVRLVAASGIIIARRTTTRVPRVDFPEERNGVTGDPWTPVNLLDKLKGEKPLTLQGSGFDYQLVAELLDPKSFRPAPLQVWRQGDREGGWSLSMSGLARGQGETAGFHERRIPLPQGAAKLLGKPGDRYAEIARRQLKEAVTTRRAVLRTALFVLFQDAPGSLDLRHAPSERKSERFLAAFDRRVDMIFFERVAAEFEAAPEAQAAARELWLEELLSIALEVLDEAVASVPLSGLRRYHTIEAARSILHATFRNRFNQKQFSDVGDMHTEGRAVDCDDLGCALDAMRAMISSLRDMNATDKVAALKRLEWREPYGLTFARLVEAAPIAALLNRAVHKHKVLQRFAVIASALAASSDSSAGLSLGRALAAIKTTPQRLGALLNARDEILVEAVRRVAAHLSFEGPLPYRQLGKLLLGDLLDPEGAETLRFEIARDYAAAPKRWSD